MSDIVIDYAYARPDPSDLAAVGVVGVMRYLSHDPRKDIGPAERDALHAAGLQVGLIWETTARRPADGFDAGRADATEANDRADALGWPTNRPLYFAGADTGDLAPADIDQYFGGVAAASRRPWGDYGSYRMVEHFADRTRWLWQCVAWSGTGQGTGGSIDGFRLSKHALLFQRNRGVLFPDTDTNAVLSPDWGGWHPEHPTPPLEDDMPSSVLVLDPDGTTWWECFTGCKDRRIIPTAFGTAEIDILHYLGCPKFDQPDQIDTRRFWLNARQPVVVTANLDIDQLIEAIRALPGDVADEVAQRLLKR